MARISEVATAPAPVAATPITQQIQVLPQATPTLGNNNKEPLVTEYEYIRQRQCFRGVQE